MEVIACAISISAAAVGASSAETVVDPAPTLPARTDNDWAKDVTALVIAPDGTWGAATEPFPGAALGKAIAGCKSKYRKEIGCGYQCVVYSVQRSTWHFWCTGYRQ